MLNYNEIPDLVRLLSDVAHWISIDEWRAGCGHALSPLQIRVLRSLSTNDTLCQRDLLNRVVGSTPTVLSESVIALEKKALITKTAAPPPLRWNIKILNITELGRRALLEVERRMALARALKEFSLEDLDVLRVLSQHLKLNLIRADQTREVPESVRAVVAANPRAES